MNGVMITVNKNATIGLQYPAHLGQTSLHKGKILFPSIPYIIELIHAPLRIEQAVFFLREKRRIQIN